MRAQINSEKHIVQHNRMDITGPAGVVNFNIVSVVEQGVAATNPQDVEIGTTVKAVYTELWVSGGNNEQTQCTAVILKTPAGANAPDTTELSQLNNYVNKKNVLQTFQGIVGDTASTNPIPVFRGWVKIPRGKQRFGLGDKYRLTIRAADSDLVVCGFSIYKAYN